MSAGNDWFRAALAAKRRGPVVEEPEAEPEKEPFPDLGQGARGSGPEPRPPSMSDILRGTLTVKRRAIADEAATERDFRLQARREANR